MVSKTQIQFTKGHIKLGVLKFVIYVFEFWEGGTVNNKTGKCAWTSLQIILGEQKLSIILRNRTMLFDYSNYTI